LDLPYPEMKRKNGQLRHSNIVLSDLNRRRLVNPQIRRFNCHKL
jgi:hypothetical protein